MNKIGVNDVKSPIIKNKIKLPLIFFFKKRNIVVGYLYTVQRCTAVIDIIKS